MQSWNNGGLENVSSIGTLTSNNTPNERQTARLNRETARQAEIKSNPAPVIWLYIHGSGLYNLIPGLSHKKPSATQEKWQGSREGERGRGVWGVNVERVVVLVGLE